MRIGIVGAGPSGLATAHYLRGKGYGDVVVFEAAARVGGKCRTLDIDGYPQELGAVIAPPGYDDVFEIAECYGAARAPAPSLRRTRLDARSDAPVMLPNLLRPASYAAGARLARLLWTHRSLARPGLAGVAGELCAPVSDYLERHALRALRDALLPAYTGYGYGYEQEIPAAYLFKMLYDGTPRRPDTWLRAIREARPTSWPAHVHEAVMFRDGYQGLWERVAAAHDVRLGCPVRSVTRGDDAVTIVAGDDPPRAFDRVVIATPPRQALAFLDAGEDERRLLERVRYFDYHSFIVELAESLGHRALYLVDNAEAGRRGRPLIIAHTQPATRLAQVYAFGDGATVDALERNIVDDARRVGVRVLRVVAHARWAEYFPHLAPGDLARFADGLEARQGRRRSYFVGEALNFGTVQSCVGYARQLVETRF